MPEGWLLSDVMFVVYWFNSLSFVKQTWSVHVSTFSPYHRNSISQQQQRQAKWLVIILQMKSRDKCSLTLPYVSRTRSSIAQYIKRDNDGRSTAGELQPGTVNKTARTVFYLQKWCRLSKSTVPSCFKSLFGNFWLYFSPISVWFLDYANNGELG